MVKSMWLIRIETMTLHSPTENSLAVLNHKILEANSQVQNVKLGGHQTCLSINRLWHELYDMLRRLAGPLLFQKDSVPLHYAYHVQTWFVDIVVQDLDWSAQNPDLNSIELMRDELDYQLGAWQ
ncbi:uncharacterized protein TNCV_539311 [Trichonephila clavipes]|nr:uncharacterized protein TNCV_539311 [Trichonephila clavipes]